jgi:hypothetical protein
VPNVKRHYFQGGILMNLGRYEEIIGTLKNVRCDGDQCVVVFAVEQEVWLSADAISIDILRGMQGKHIGLLNCDGSYKIRRIKTPKG